MSLPLFTNNAATALARGITPIDTILQLTPGTGSYFPQPTGGNYFMLTLVQINNPEVSEIVECIDRVGDTLTVVRGQEGTQPQIFNISDNVQLRITAQSLNLFAAESHAIEDLAAYEAAVASSSGSSLVGYNEGGTGAVTRTVQAKLQEQVSVLDFGADPTGTTDSTAAINAAIQASYTVYVPDGTYLISGVIKLGENRQGNIKLIGQSSQHTEFKFTTSAAQLRCNVNHAWVVINNIKLNGNSVATNALVLGAIGTFPGAGSVDYLDGVIATGCVSHGFVFYGLQYSVMANLLATNNGGAGIYCYSCGNLSFNQGIVNTNNIGIWLGGDGSTYSACSSIWFNGMDNYDNTNQFIYFYSAFNIYLNNCTFENEFVLPTPMISIEQHGSYYTSNIYFDGCLFAGLAHAQNLVEIGTGNIPNITFNQCRSIYPSATYYIVKNLSNQPVMINDCYGGNGYSDYYAQYWDGYISGLFKEARTQNTLVQQNFTNNYVGFNQTPVYRYDFGTPSATPSGTTILQRLYAENWNGATGNEYFADTFLTTSSSTGVGYNRGIRFDMNNGAFTIGGINRTGGNWVWSTDVPIQTNGSFAPYADNTFSLGFSFARWSVVYAATGSINTSDGNQKTIIGSLDEAEQATAKAIKGLFKKFKFKDSIAEKGEDKARIHFGVIAQEVEAAFTANGLDANKYALFCSDTWYTDAEGKNYKSKLDENGIEILNLTLHTQLGIRYDELLAFVISAM